MMNVRFNQQMQRSVAALLALLMVMAVLFGGFSPTTHAADNSVTVYYKKGFTSPYIHYRQADGNWTTAPGVKMADAEVSGYTKATINIGTYTQLEAVFNNGNGTWDNNGSKNYLFNTGTSTFTPGTNGAAGTITAGAPSGSTTPTDPSTPVSDNFGPVDWSKRSIYFIMTDRFSNGDTSNDNYGGFNSNKSNPGQWHGGDFQGIINKLDYIKNMGFTAIWITPVTMQKSTYAYHGYHTYDFYSVDGHLGNMAKFQELVRTAHSKNIAVMLDVVVNHTGDFRPNNGTAKAPFDQADWYHNAGDITQNDYNTNNQSRIENGDVASLDDLKQENTAVATELKNWGKWIIQQSGVDGLRVDTAKHVPKWFLKDFDSAVNTFTIGEVFNGDPTYVGDYTNYLDAALDFPMYYTIRDVFAKDGSMNLIKDRYAQDNRYKNANLNGTFIDNHDVKRFLNEASGKPGASYDKWPQLKAALGFLLTSRGIPIVYQGTEQGFSGGDDPANREDMTFDTSNELYKYIAKLNAVRNTHPALQNGSQKEKWSDNTVYGFQRTSGSDDVVVLINNSWNSETRTIPNLDNFGNGTALKNQLGTDSVTVNGGSITITLAPKEVKILTK